MNYVILGFLWVSLLIYLLTGGADYGAGILEWLSKKRYREQIRSDAYRAIGPVWEANHMWLIIAVVIMFVGFPQIYAAVAIYLHIPLVLMLLGIIARGTAFSFRNYDAVKDDTQRLYSRLYVYSSFVTPLFLGIIAGSAVSGEINLHALSFPDVYINGWFNWFSVAVGLFTVFLCAFISAVYLSGVARDDSGKDIYIYKAKVMTVLAILSLALVFWSSLYQHIPLVTWLFGNPVCLAASCGAAVSLIFVLTTLKSRKAITVRIATGLAITLLWIAVTYGHYPNIVIMKDGTTLSLKNPDVSPSTVNALGIALLAGSLLILPSLFYLIYSFNKRETNDYSQDPSHS